MGGRSVVSEIIVSFDMLKKIEHLNYHRSPDLTDFGLDTCCDYVDSLRICDSRYGVTIFVEPCGDITKWGPSFETVLDWWLTVFSTQPDGWDYCCAGWYLNELAERGLSDDASVVWSVMDDWTKYLGDTKHEVGSRYEMYGKSYVITGVESREVLVERGTKKTMWLHTMREATAEELTQYITEGRSVRDAEH